MMIIRFVRDTVLTAAMALAVIYVALYVLEAIL